MDLIPIYENYGKYKPPRNTVRIVRTFLVTVPPEYLQGLGAIILCCSSSLSRNKRRSKTWSRGKKVSLNKALGCYHQEWGGEPASIELYVDNIYQQWPSLLARLPLLSSLLVAKTLFHEIGHHIHCRHRPEFKEREDVADEWSRKLMSSAVRKRYWYLVPLLRLIRRLYLHWKKRQPTAQPLAGSTQHGAE